MTGAGVFEGTTSISGSEDPADVVTSTGLAVYDDGALT